MGLKKAQVQATDIEELNAQDITDIKTKLEIIEEAPQDGKIYGRKDGQWVEITQPEPDPLIITLIGDNPQTIGLNDAYTELGATTNDGTAVTIDSSEVNTSVIGTYNVYYNATNTSGVIADEVIRTVNVQDLTSPNQPTITNVTI